MTGETDEPDKMVVTLKYLKVRKHGMTQRGGTRGTRAREATRALIRRLDPIDCSWAGKEAEEIKNRGLCPKYPGTTICCRECPSVRICVTSWRKGRKYCRKYAIHRWCSAVQEKLEER